MPGLLSSALKVELRKATPEVYLALTVNFPDETWLLSSAALASTAQGEYLPRVKNWGAVGRSVELWPPSLGLPDTRVTIIDEDRRFSRLLAGESLPELRGSTATIHLRSPNVADVDSFLLFSGILEHWSQPDMITAELSFASDMRLLRSFFPAVSISEADYPFADPSALGGYYPILYGVHSSVGASGNGAVPCLFVDTVANTYLLCLGRANRATGVYKDGVVVSDYTVEYVERNGVLRTEIVFGADQGEAAITCDCEGYETVGGTVGGGTLITNPADQLKHLLSNFVFGEYKTGAWLSVSTRIDTTSFGTAATFFTAKGSKGAKYLGTEQRRGEEVLTEWSASWFAHPFLTNAGKLGVAILDHRKATVYVDDPWVRVEDIASFRPSHDPDHMLKRISVQYAYDSVQKKFMRTLEVADLSSTEVGTLNLPMPWSEAVS